MPDARVREQSWGDPIRDKPEGTELDPILEGLDFRTGHAQMFF